MTFSGKMWLMIISKLKKTRPHPASKKYIFRKTRGRMSNWTGWEYSRWEFSGWKFSGGNVPGGNFLTLFSFSMFFLYFSVLFHFFYSLLIKEFFLSWELIKMFLAPLTSLKYVHVNDVNGARKVHFCK